jgi:hypothetical protein
LRAHFPALIGGSHRGGSPCACAAFSARSPAGPAEDIGQKTFDLNAMPISATKSTLLEKPAREQTRHPNEFSTSLARAPPLNRRGHIWRQKMICLTTFCRLGSWFAAAV